MKNLLYCLISFAILWNNGAGADEICLKNGNCIEGIIAQETDVSVEIEPFLNAKIAFPQADIAYIKRATAEENAALKERWLQENKEREQAELARQRFEAEQRAKGLTKFKGEWIPESERDEIQTREYIDTVLQEKDDYQRFLRTQPKGRSKVGQELLKKQNWQSRETEHFIVYYEDLMQSKVVADRAEYYYEKIAYDLDYELRISWPKKCEVFIIPNEDKWEEYMRKFTARFDHIGGFVPQTGEKEIYLCALSSAYLSVSFPHELTHLIFYEFAQGKEIPLWLNEGLAIYESGLIGYADEMLREKVKEAEHIPIRELVGAKHYPEEKEQTELFYAQSEKIVEFLITQHGRKRFAQFTKMLIQGKTFSKALDSVYADAYPAQEEFKQAWIRYVLK